MVSMQGINREKGEVKLSMNLRGNRKYGEQLNKKVRVAYGFNL